MMDVFIFCSDVWGIIFDFSELSHQMNILRVHKTLSHLKIKKIERGSKLNNVILRRSIFSNLIYLNVNNNANVSMISHLSHLQILKCGWGSKIFQSEIDMLPNLTELYCSDNIEINSVRENGKIRKLICRGKSGINQEGVDRAFLLEELKTDANDKITSVKHMKLLEKIWFKNVGNKYIEIMPLLPEMKKEYGLLRMQYNVIINHLNNIPINKIILDYIA